MKPFRFAPALLLALLAGPARAQDPFGPRQVDPRAVRAAREAQVARVGEAARALVEEYPEAAAALAACRPATGLKLAEFYNDGGMRKLPNPPELLASVARPGHADDVALWAIQNADKLADVDAWRAFLTEPVSYAVAVKKLDAGAAEQRARRMAYQAPAGHGHGGGGGGFVEALNLRQLGDPNTWVAFAVLAAGFYAFYAFFKRRRRPPDE